MIQKRVKLDGVENGLEISAAIDPRVEQKCIRLRDEWKSQRGPVSSTTKLVMHPAYQTIIGMGIDVVPLLLHELDTNFDQWFWALHAITEADPVSEKDRGDGQAMARAWLERGRDQGYQPARR
jgi:hypothetical protein